jgi:DNA-binding NarL/FixJ family response regulator
VWRPRRLPAPRLPAPRDPALLAILAGFARAAGASGCILRLTQAPDGPTVSYRWGVAARGARQRVEVRPAENLSGECELYARASTARTLRSSAALVPMLEGALHALAERCAASRQVELLVSMLGVDDEAHLLVDECGKVVFANPRGEEVLARAGLRARRRGGASSPMVDVIIAEIRRLRAGDGRVRRQVVATTDGSQWRLEIVGLPGLSPTAYFLVLLTPTRLPGATEIRERFERFDISPREADVLAAALQGHKVAAIARQLGISEYTVKDHFKHAYAKLRISSRGQLLSRLASTAGV